MEVVTKQEEGVEKQPTQDDYRLQYATVAQRAGDLQYRILCYKNELAACNDEMLKINQASIALAKQEEANVKG